MKALGHKADEAAFGEVVCTCIKAVGHKAGEAAFREVCAQE